MSSARTRSFFAARPELRERMAQSEAFQEIKRAARIEIDDEELYLVRGDAFGEEEELFVEAVIRGAAGQGEANRRLHAELTPAERESIVQAFTR